MLRRSQKLKKRKPSFCCKIGTFLKFNFYLISKTRDDEVNVRKFVSPLQNVKTSLFLSHNRFFLCIQCYGPVIFKSEKFF
jgi:hypothetical protein